MVYSLKDFEEIKHFCDRYNINYEYGNYHDDDDNIIGHWLDIQFISLTTNDLTPEDIAYNEKEE